MKGPGKIRIQNTVPHLLEAIWNHPDCPGWLQNLIWDGINDRCERTEMSATYWASQLESARPDAPDEFEKNYGYDEPPAIAAAAGNVIPFPR